MDSEAVIALIRHVAAEIVLPRFKQLADYDIQEKSPGEVVTTADRDAEQMLVDGFARLAPGVPVVGEEATSKDPSLLNALHADRVLLVDPIDGTSNFVAGNPEFAMMVALVERGVTTAGWIHQPISRATFFAERGAGAYCDAKRLSRRDGIASRPAELRGVAPTRFFGPEMRSEIESRRADFARLENGARCAGVDYPLLSEGKHDFILYQRALPWDVAAGVLLVEEVGGLAKWLDGRPYGPRDDSAGLLVAGSDTLWPICRDALLGAGFPTD